MATKNTKTQDQAASIKESVKNMLSTYTDGQGSPVQLEWAKDKQDKTILIDNIPEIQIAGDKVLFDLPEGGQTIDLSAIFGFILYQGWKDSNYVSSNYLLSLLAAGAVSKLHFNKINSDTDVSEKDHPFIGIENVVSASRLKGKVKPGSYKILLDTDNSQVLLNVKAQVELLGYGWISWETSSTVDELTGIPTIKVNGMRVEPRND